MASSTDPDALVDSSVAIAALVQDHPDNGRVHDSLRGRRLGMAGHALFETFSVLTRLPPENRLGPAAAASLIERQFPLSRFVSGGFAAGLVPRLVAAGVAGGSVFDALVAAAAAEHNLPLVTRDRRAAQTYVALGATAEYIGEPSS